MISIYNELVDFRCLNVPRSSETADFIRKSTKQRIEQTMNVRALSTTRIAWVRAKQNENIAVNTYNKQFRCIGTQAKYKQMTDYCAIGFWLLLRLCESIARVQ